MSSGPQKSGKYRKTSHGQAKNSPHGGDAIVKDDAEAVKWHRLAAEQGNASAQYPLAFMYDNGKGVPEDAERLLDSSGH